MMTFWDLELSSLGMGSTYNLDLLTLLWAFNFKRIIDAEIKQQKL